MRQMLLSGARWARKNRPAAVTLITAAKILIGFITFNLGVFALSSGFTMPEYLKWWFAGAGVAALLYYPTIRLKSVLDYEAYFLTKKRTDLMMAVLGMFLWFLIGNHTAQWATQTAVNESVTTSSVTPANGSLTGNVKGWAAPDRARGLAKYTQQKIRQHLIRKIEAWGKRSDDGRLAVQILLTLLIVLVLAALGILIAGLACNLSCSGNDTAAAVLLVLGWGGLLIGFLFALKGIWWSAWSRGQSSGIDDRHKKKNIPN